MFAIHRQSKGETDLERLWLVVIAGTAAAAALWLRFGLPTPLCPFHTLTGYPCLTCGGTRCVKNLLAGHFATAFAWNPLVFALAMLSALYSIYAAVVVAFGLPRIRLGQFSTAERYALRIGAGAVLAANWIYLIYHFSRLA